MELKIASRQCEDQRGAPKRFHYYLTVDQAESPGFFMENYGVRIADEDGGDAQIPAITTSASRIDELMELLTRNFVTPTTLRDVIDDWL